MEQCSCVARCRHGSPLWAWCPHLRKAGAGAPIIAKRLNWKPLGQSELQASEASEGDDAESSPRPGLDLTTLFCDLPQGPGYRVSGRPCMSAKAQSLPARRAGTPPLLQMR